MLIQNARYLDHINGRFVLGDIWVRDGKIVALGSVPCIDEEWIDAKGKPVIPGLVDVHTHGCVGHDFVSCPENVLGEMARFYASHGVTTVMPTVASAPLCEMLAAVSRVNAFSPAETEADLFGVHLEGRYLNAAKRGAHAPELLSALEADELEAQELRKCRALHITAAYELDSDGAFAKKAKALGATLGLGHTAATYAEAKEAEARGVSAYTHLYNCMPALHHRDGGAICAALEGNCFVELISDGIHISPEMIRLAARLATSERVTLISDSMEATGCPDGNYAIAGNPVVVENGKALTPDGALAGSTLTLDVALERFMQFTGLPLSQAAICASVNPAKQMGIFETVGSIEVGKRADLLILSGWERFEIERVMVRGRFLDLL